MVKAHAKEIEDILLQNAIIGYSDSSKLDSQGTGAGIYLINGTTFSKTCIEYLYYLGRHIEAYDAELLAILKTLQLSLKVVERSIDKHVSVYIYSDSAAAIQRLQNHLQVGPGFSIVSQCISIAQKLVEKRAKVSITWISSHIGIPGNEKADELAKRAAQSQRPTPYIKVSLTNIRRRLNSSILEKW